MILAVVAEELRHLAEPRGTVMFGLLEELWLTVLPEFVTYEAAISTCDPGEYGQQALALLAEARRVDVVPDVITYDAWLSLLVLLAAGAAKA